MLNVNFYQGKKVLLTGHTGFKGAWMCRLLIHAGAILTGYGLEPETEESLFKLAKVEDKMNSVIGDIRDLDRLMQVFLMAQPEIVIHMAAQPLVRESYTNPVYTYDVNVMGTVNILECVRQNPCVISFLNVTTDKVYLNREWEWGYRENEELNGFDPYSNSKSCSELVTGSYYKAFFAKSHTAISTARAGNVIGGGDFAKDRIIPDCVRAAYENNPIIVRNPDSTRPYQHVLEPICAYLLIAMKQYEEKACEGSYNIGPEDKDCFTTGNLVELFCKQWNQQTGNNLNWLDQSDGGPHEANFLKLDCSKMKKTFDWTPKWNLQIAMDHIVSWALCYQNGEDVVECMNEQIKEYLSFAP